MDQSASILGSVYERVNVGLRLDTKDSVCQFYESIRSRLASLSYEDFAHGVLPIARFVAERCEICNDPDKMAAVFCSQLSKYLIPYSGQVQYSVPREITDRYPYEGALTQEKLMIIIACEFVDYYESTRS